MIFRNWKFILLFTFNILFFGYQLYHFSSSVDGKQPQYEHGNEQNSIFNNSKLNLSLDTLFKRPSDRLIVLRMLKNQCSECRDSIFNNTIKLASTFGKNSVVILFDDSYTYEEYIQFKRIYQYELENLFHISNKVSHLDGLGNSYYFFNSISDPSTAQNLYQIKEFKEVGYSVNYMEWLSEVKKVLNM
jgi:hypothetical protein